MRRRQRLAVLVGATAVWGAVLLAVPGAAGAWAVAATRGAVPAGMVPAAGSWGRAVEVPGLGALNKGGNAQVLSVSCASAASCAAGGYYRGEHRHYQGFVAVERHGRWGRATRVTGLRALNTGGNARVGSVSCTSAGNCAAAGTYTDGDGHQLGFVVREMNGRWGRATGVRGLAALNTGGNAGISEVSCASAGNCTAAGNYTDGDGHQQGFAVSEQNGRWGRAIQVPGLGTLNQGGYADVREVSCGSAGNCGAAGQYTDADAYRQGFVVSEENGVWRQAIEVPGLGALNQGAAGVLSVSCASAGNCAAGGNYTDGDFNYQGFVVSEKNGVWRQAIEVPGLGALNAHNNNPSAYVGSVSCASPGDCTAGGAYGSPYSWAFVASEKNGVWGKAINVPGLGALVNGRWASVGSVSCASPGNCAAAGSDEHFAPDGPFDNAFVIIQRNGRWDRATGVPGLGTLNKGGNAGVSSVSCGAAGTCAVAGHYTDARGRLQGFVTQYAVRQRPNATHYQVTKRPFRTRLVLGLTRLDGAHIS